MKSPCLECINRHIRCHSECPMYKAFREERDDTLKRNKIEHDKKHVLGKIAKHY